MGAGVSGWRLARAVSKRGHLGVVAGTAVDTILVRQLQRGDPGGHVRRALGEFPVPEIADRVLERYFIPGGKPEGVPFRRVRMYSLAPPLELFQLTVALNFAEIYLAKEGHDGVVGVNLLEKIQMPNLASLYGAMLADVDYVLMGAGIPREIPGVLDRFADHAEATLKITVAGETAEDDFRMRFDPVKVVGALPGKLKRPFFLAIIASTVLAKAMKYRSTGTVNGFVIEGPTAGGHNAPPRGRLALDGNGEPIYGERDVVDLDKIAELGLPFWLAGSHGRKGCIAEALARGATGVQVGTVFAFCEESGLDPALKHDVLLSVLDGTAVVYTDPLASPTGFPFKVIQHPGSVAETSVYEARTRVCDLGYLRTAYRLEDGRVGYRCPSEPIDTYVRKGGKIEDTQHRRCVCNGLLANLGLPQLQSNQAVEPTILTCGDDLVRLGRFLHDGSTTYTAADVIEELCDDSEFGDLIQRRDESGSRGLIQKPEPLQAQVC